MLLSRALLRWHGIFRLKHVTFRVVHDRFATLECALPPLNVILEWLILEWTLPLTLPPLNSIFGWLTKAMLHWTPSSSKS